MRQKRYKSADGAVLRIFETTNSDYAIGWCYPSEAGSTPADAPLHPDLCVCGRDLEYHTANRAVASYAYPSKINELAFRFETKKQAREALAAANKALFEASSKEGQ